MSFEIRLFVYLPGKNVEIRTIKTVPTVDEARKYCEDNKAIQDGDWGIFSLEKNDYVPVIDFASRTYHNLTVTGSTGKKIYIADTEGHLVQSGECRIETSLWADQEYDIQFGLNGKKQRIKLTEPMTIREHDYWYWKEKRDFVLARDKCCVWCNKELNVRTARIDHLTPKIKGGSDDYSNLALSCYDCNNEKADMMPLEYIQKKTGNVVENPAPVKIMVIEDVYNIYGKGTAFTGTFLKYVRVGTKIKIMDETCELTIAETNQGQDGSFLGQNDVGYGLVISGLETFNKVHDEITAGTMGGMLVRGLVKGTIQKGMIVVQN